MKKLLLTIALMGTVACAFGQGRIDVVNDSASLLTLTTDTLHILPADLSLKGVAVANSTPLLSGAMIDVGLYGGTSSSALYLYSTSLLNNTVANSAGSYGQFNIQLTSQTDGAPAIAGIPSGTTISSSTPYFQVKFWDSRFSTYEAAKTASVTGTANNYYGAVSAIFQVNPGSSLTYTHITPPSANTTWTEGAIYLGTLAPVPEPTSFVFLGLGAATLLVLRRRQ